MNMETRKNLIEAFNKMQDAYMEIGEHLEDPDLVKAFEDAGDLYSRIFRTSFDNIPMQGWCGSIIRALEKLECSSVYTAYSPKTDLTFIMRETISVDKVTTECIGWYYGEPNEEDTETFSDGCMKSTYENERGDI